jgi:hypothetical protein
LHAVDEHRYDPDEDDQRRDGEIHIALFKKVEWKPIPHESNVSIEQLSSENNKSENKK